MRSTFVALLTACTAAQSIDFAALKAYPSPPVPTFAVGVKSQKIPYNALAAVASASSALSLGQTATGTHSKREAFIIPTMPIMSAPLPGQPTFISNSGKTVHHTKSHHHSKSTETFDLPRNTHTGPHFGPLSGSWLPTFVPELNSPHVAARDTAIKSVVSATSTLSACAVEPTGAGPVPTPDTAVAWAADAHWSKQALSEDVPNSYQETFSNLNASVAGAYGYLGFQYIGSYNAQKCANLCDSMDGCNSFNIYFERDPCLSPAAACSNPESTTSIRCSFWSGQVDESSATYTGEMRDEFQVLVGGSNGYIRYDGCTNPPLPGYSQPEYLGNATILAQPDWYVHLI